MRTTLVIWALALMALPGQQPASAPAASAQLDFEFFKTKVQPILLAKRPGHARCVSCHGGRSVLRLEPLAKGASSWTEEESRKNFQAVQRVAVPGDAEEPSSASTRSRSRRAATSITAAASISRRRTTRSGRH